MQDSRSVLVGCLLAVCSASAAAQDSAQPVLEWQSDSSCAAPADIEARLAKLTTHDARQTAASYVAQVATRDHGYRLELRSKHDDSLKRVVELPSCEETRETALLMVAMALQPNPELAEREPEQPHEPWRFALGAGALLDALSLPSPAFGGTLSAHMQRDWLRFSLAARYDAAKKSDTLPDDIEAKLSVLAFAARGCFVWSEAQLSLLGCGELEAGRIGGRATGVENARTQRAPWLSLGAVGALEYALTSHLALQLAVHAGAVFRPPSFALDDMAPFHDVPRASLRTAFSLLVWLDAKD